VLDRWFGQFKLFNEINAMASSYVCRVKENSRFDVVEEKPLNEEARCAGVLRDVVVKMGLSSKPSDRPDHPIRLIVIQATPHEKRGSRGKTAGPGNKGTIVIATNLLDVPAHLIALIYQHRWAIEIFFRFFKQMLSLPAPAEPQAAGDFDPGLLCDHRLHVDQPVDGQTSEQGDVRNAQLVFHGNHR
jgi:hypothetical protein